MKSKTNRLVLFLSTLLIFTSCSGGGGGGGTGGGGSSITVDCPAEQFIEVADGENEATII